MSKRRTYQTDSFNERKNYSLNRYDTDNFSERYYLKEALCKIDSELIELKKNIKTIEPQYNPYRTQITYNEEPIPNYSRTPKTKKPLWRDPYTKFSFEIIANPTYERNEDADIKISEKEKIINNLLNDLVLLEKKVDALSSENKDIKSQLRYELSIKQEKDKEIRDLLAEKTALEEENKNLKLDNVTLYKMCNENEENLDKFNKKRYVDEMENDQVVIRGDKYNYDYNNFNQKGRDDDIFRSQVTDRDNISVNNNEGSKGSPILRDDPYQKYKAIKKMGSGIHTLSSQDGEPDGREYVILEDSGDNNSSSPHINSKYMSFREKMKMSPDGENAENSNNFDSKTSNSAGGRDRFKSSNIEDNMRSLVNNNMGSLVSNTQNNSIDPNSNNNYSSSVVINNNGSNEKVNQLMNTISYLNNEITSHEAEIMQSREDIQKLKNENQMYQKRRPSNNVLTEARQQEYQISKKSKDPYNRQQLTQPQLSMTKSFTETLSKNNKSSWISRLRTKPEHRTSFSQSGEKTENLEDLIFAVFDQKIIISFEVPTQIFCNIGFIDQGNFAENYTKEGSMSLNVNNSLYIITGENYNLLYQFSPITKTMNFLTKLNTNHSFGGFIAKDRDHYLCISGAYNKNIEVYSTHNNKWKVEKNTLLTERSECAYLILNKEFLFAFFGFNCRENIYLPTVEFCNMKDYIFREINVVVNDLNLSLEIKGHFIYPTAKDETELILVGGFDGKNNKGVQNYIQIEIQEDHGNLMAFAKEIDQKIHDIDIQKQMIFGGNWCDFDKEIIAVFDNKEFAHVMNAVELTHNIFYFS